MIRLKSILSVGSVLAVLTQSPIKASIVESQELITAKSELLKLQAQRDKVRNYAYRDGGEDDPVNQQIRKDKDDAEEKWRDQKLKVLKLEIDGLSTQLHDFNEKTIEISKNYEKTVLVPAKEKAKMDLMKRIIDGSLTEQDMDKEVDRVFEDIKQKNSFDKTEEFLQRQKDAVSLGSALDKKLKERGDLLEQMRQDIANKLAKQEARLQDEKAKPDLDDKVAKEETLLAANKAKQAKGKAVIESKKTELASALKAASETVKSDKQELIKKHDEEIARLEKLLKDNDEMVKKVDKSPGTIMFYNMFKATGDSYKAKIDVLKKGREYLMKK